MHSVESIAAEIVRREGGYVNDPDDPGGATKHGVTLKTLQGLKADLTGDGRVDVADVKALTPAQAAEIYVRHYYRAPRIDLLPEPLQASVFDMQVNAGANAVRILQRLMAAFGLPLKDDGVIGPVTARTVAQAMEAAPDHLVDAYGIARRSLLLPARRPAAGEPQVRPGAGRRQGRVDHARRGVHLRALPPHPRRARPEGGGMGLIGTILGAGGAARQVGEAVGGVAEVFVGNRAERDADAAGRALATVAEFGAEFAHAPAGRWDGFVNGLNRLPRPMLALGTLGLFAYAMAAPAGFSTRMQGLQLVPEPLWWLLGAIVSFYFGARELHHQRTRALPRLAAGLAAARPAARPEPAAAAPAGEPASPAALTRPTRTTTPRWRSGGASAPEAPRARAARPRAPPATAAPDVEGDPPPSPWNKYACRRRLPRDGAASSRPPAHRVAICPSRGFAA